MAIRVPAGDLYAELGVVPTATADEISVAFRALARELHPDAHPGTAPDSEVAERFKRVSAAYRVLSDRDERARYDASRVDAARRGPSAGANRAAGTGAGAATVAGNAAAGPAVTSPSIGSSPPQPMLLGWSMTRRRGRVVLGAGLTCLLLAILVSVWVLADPDTGAADQTARNITLWIVAAKLLVGGGMAVFVGQRRLRDPLP